jgi:hypothetical protein
MHSRELIKLDVLDTKLNKALSSGEFVYVVVVESALLKKVLNMVNPCTKVSMSSSSNATSRM